MTAFSQIFHERYDVSGTFHKVGYFFYLYILIQKEHTQRSGFAIKLNSII